MTKQAEVKEALYKDWALHNKKVKKYCKDNDLHMNLLSQLKVDYLPDRLVFLKPTGVTPIGNLANDIDTQPKAILGVIISVKNGTIKVSDCESTEYTNLIKNH